MTDARTPSRLTVWVLTTLKCRDETDAVVGNLSEELARLSAEHRQPRWPAVWLELRAWWHIVAALGNVGIPFGSELRWAWRGVRGRRIGALIHVALVALAVGSGAVVFSAADAFVFQPSPYPHAHRIVVFQRDSIVGVIESLQPEEQLELSRRTDLFTAWYAHSMGAPVRISGAGFMRTQDVQPGLFEALGVVPRWGRPLTAGDEQPIGNEQAAVIRGDLARTLFGDPAAAVGQTIATDGGLFRVVGVMPDDFRFPTALEKIWRAPVTVDFPPTVAVLAPGVSINTVEHIVDAFARTTAAARDKATDARGSIRAVQLSGAKRDPRAFTNSGAFTSLSAPRLFSMLLGVAVCLALIICLNVASLELAVTLERSRIFAVQTALGATRGTLIRAALFETAILTTLGALAGVGLATWGTTLLTATLPSALAAILTNPIDLDWRTAGFMTGLALAAAILTSIPVVWYASRPGLADGLRWAAGVATPTRAQRSVRHLLITGQVALSAALLAVATLFVRSYDARLDDKGFDSANLAAIEIQQPRNAPQNATDLGPIIQTRLHGHPAVQSFARASLLLPGGFRGGVAQHLWTLGATSPSGLVATGNFDVNPGYFSTIGIRLLSGRFVGAEDSPEQVVIDEAFARRFWPNGNALGARFSLGRDKSPGKAIREIVGVVSNVQLEVAEVPRGGTLFAVYRRLSRDAAPLSYVVRLATAGALSEVMSLVRSAAPGSQVRVELMDDRYAEIFADTRIAAQVTGGFGLIALLVAMLGLYGVAAFLVTGRTREIGIRIALGAGRGNVQRLVLRSAMWAVAVGTVAGSGLAVFTSRWFGSQLFGVVSTDPSTYLAVASAMLLTALLAAWRPARRAASIDPAVTLRAE